MNFEVLHIKINQLLKPVEGDVSLFFKDLITNVTFKINENVLFNTASLMKVFVGLQYLQLIEKGKINVSVPVKLKNSFRSKFDNSLFELSPEIDSDPDLYNKIGSEINAMELIERMITRSSNLSTNNLFELIEKQSNIDDLLKETGVSNTRIIRGVEDQKAFDAGITNVTTAADMVKVLEYIHAGVLNNDIYITQLYNFLLKQQHNSIIPLHLPKNLLIAHKTGNLSASIHDAAIISSPEGVGYILVILSKNLHNKEKATAVFAKVSEVLYSFLLDN